MLKPGKGVSLFSKTSNSSFFMLWDSLLRLWVSALNVDYGRGEVGNDRIMTSTVGLYNNNTKRCSEIRAVGAKMVLKRRGSANVREERKLENWLSHGLGGLGLSCHCDPGSTLITQQASDICESLCWVSKKNTAFLWNKSACGVSPSKNIFGWSRVQHVSALPYSHQLGEPPEISPSLKLTGTTFAYKSWHASKLIWPTKWCKNVPSKGYWTLPEEMAMGMHLEERVDLTMASTGGREGVCSMNAGSWSCLMECRWVGCRIWGCQCNSRAALRSMGPSFLGIFVCSFVCFCNLGRGLNKAHSS